MNDPLSAIVLETRRLILREIVENDAGFVNTLLNTSSFIKYIGDRGVRSVEDARVFIRERYRQSYVDHGYGLFAVQLRSNSTPIGMCGFVRRGSLPGPDVGFAFLPQYERQGFGYESASAVMRYSRETLRFDTVYAITALDNEASIRLLEKLDFKFDRVMTLPDGNNVNLFRVYSSE